MYSSSNGVITELEKEERIILELRKNGRCTLTLGKSKKNGSWKEDGDRLQVNCGKIALYGNSNGRTLVLHSLSGNSPELTFFENIDEAFIIPEGLMGEWTLKSVTAGDEVYSDLLLNSFGYSGMRLSIQSDGKGMATLLDGEEHIISVKNRFVHCNGRLMEYTFSDNELCITYTDGIILKFVKQSN